MLACGHAATAEPSAIGAPPTESQSVQDRTEGGFHIVTGDVERLAGRKPRALRDPLREAFQGR
jgi:hypothetical protein